MTDGTFGVRYARGCHPDDLWKKYFTSSKVVQEYREKYGEPDVVEVRQTFNDSLQAREWEHKILRRLAVIKNERWLNKGTGKAIPPMFGANHWCFGRGFSEKHLKNLRKPKSTTTNMKHTKSQIERMRKPKSEETKQKMKDSFTEERKLSISQKFSKLIWITDGENNIRISKDSPIPEGWKRGRPSKNCGKGSKRTREQIEKIKEKRKMQIMKKGWFWITDGAQNQRFYEAELVPKGWHRGVTKNANKKRSSQEERS